MSEPRSSPAPPQSAASKKKGASVDVADALVDANRRFSAYLQAYTKASVALLRRWPAFVPEDERYADTLEKGTRAAARVFGDSDLGPEQRTEPELRGLKVVGVAPPRGRSRGGDVDGGGGDDANEGTAAAAVGGGGGGRDDGAGAERRETPSRPASAGGVSQSAASHTTGVSGYVGGGGGAGGGGGGGADVEALKAKIEKLNAKLRYEVNERSKANDEATRRGLQLQSLQRDNAALNEAVKRQAQQLEHAREVTLRLEEQQRELSEASSSGEDRLVAERKLRHTWQLRAEKYAKRIEPLEAEAKVLKESLASTVALLAEARGRGEAAAGEASALKKTTTRLKSVTQKAMRDSIDARESTAQSELQLTLMADRRDELLDRVASMEAEAAAQAARLEELRRGRDEATELARRERQRREACEAAAQETFVEAEDKGDELAEWQGKAYKLEAELRKQREHVAALLTQDAVREAEQRKLFESVTELLARVQYLGDTAPERLSMSRAEALQHKDEAIRHLRALREAHALSTFPAQLVLHPATVGAGAAMLASPRASSGGAVGRSPRGGSKAATPRPNLTGGGGGGGGGDAFETWRQGVDLSDVPKRSPRGDPGGRFGRRGGGDPAKVAAAATAPAAEWEKSKLLSVMNET